MARRPKNFQETAEEALRQMRLARYDPSNIPGSRLAEIGRLAMGMPTKDPQAALEMMANMQKQSPRPIKEGELMDMAWLDQRVNEICQKGKM